MRLAIVGGKVFDPAADWHGQERDLYIQDGRLVEYLPAVDAVIQARGLAVTPAALEIRSAAAAFGQNYLRLWGLWPTPREMGETYALLGYTHIHEPYLTLQTANYVHRELAAIPVVDASASLVLNLQEFDLWLREPERHADLAEAWAYLLEQTRALDLRLVEPWVRFRPDFLRPRWLTTAAVLERLLPLVQQRGLPLTLEASPELLQGDLPVQPGLHLSNLGPALTDPETADRALALLAQGISADMGLLPPASRTDLPAHPVQVDLGWFQPFDPLPPVSPPVARRALHLALAGRDYHLAFSVSSLGQIPPPSFPHVFAWLGNAASRRQDWGEGQPGEELTFLQWLRATRTLPARYLGLADRGHLQPGARADVALYDLPRAGAWPETCRRCRLLLKAGQVVVQNFTVVHPEVAKVTYYRRGQGAPNKLAADLCQQRSLRPENIWVRLSEPGRWQQVA
jgi:formylmethanofuran dehydrogenase subunit A